MTAADADKIVLLCNPRAGGRWRELAGILDSAEARHVRRVVTDSIDDIGPALQSLGRKVKLLCIYGGDGTIQKILTDMLRMRGSAPPIALLGGGTMNVTSGVMGWSRSAEDNFRRVVREFLAGTQVTREVPLLEVRQGERVEYGFTFGAGTVIHLLDSYENGRKGMLAAAQLVGEAASAVWTGWPARVRDSLEPVTADIVLDEQRVPYDKFMVVFCNTTGEVEIGVRPFNHKRTPDTFHALAYAVDRRELLTFLPFLARGMTPIDPRSLLQPKSLLERARLSFVGKTSLPPDPRYVNRAAHEVVYRSPDPLYTIDGEIFRSDGEAMHVKLGPSVRLVVPA